MAKMPLKRQKMPVNNLGHGNAVLHLDKKNAIMPAIYGKYTDERSVRFVLSGILAFFYGYVLDRLVMMES
jgi:hypothetical protein